jgi:glycosyltransferase involved in cell wall biosynthesis
MILTVGLPFLNSERTLLDAVRSIYAQTLTDWQLILVDDGSTDTSLSLARSIRDPRVMVVSDGRNRGLAYRLNQIASLARGKYLARMDSDDLMHPRRLWKQVSFLEENARVDVVGTQAYTIDAENNPTGIRGVDPLDTRLAAVLKKGLMVHPTVMGRLAWFQGNRYDERFIRAEDHELWCRTCSGNSFARLDEPLYFYREGPSVNLRNYMMSLRTDRKIAFEYGPEHLGFLPTCSMVAGTYVKELAYRSLSFVKGERFLVAMRSKSLPESVKVELKMVIEGIRTTQIPRKE